MRINDKENYENIRFKITIVNIIAKRKHTQ